VVVSACDTSFADYLSPSYYRANNDLELNLLLAGGMLMNKNQTHASLVIHSPPDVHGSIGDTDISDGIQRSRTKSIRLDDPSFAIELPKTVDGQKTEIEYIQPEADFDGFINSYELFETKWAQAEGLPSDYFRLGGPEKTATASHIIDKRLSKSVKYFQNIWIAAEKEIYKLSIDLLRNEIPSIPIELRNSELNIEFFSEYNLLDNSSVDDLIKLKRESVIDAVEVLARASGLNMSEAEEKYIVMMERKKRLQEKFNLQETQNDTEQFGSEGERGNVYREPEEKRNNTRRNVE
jgi:hypothetical protein